MKLKSILKASSVVFLYLALFSTKANAAIDTVRVVNIQFQPANLNVLVGDTIVWMWGAGFHTSTSGSIPDGAGVWDAPITNANRTFQYIVTVPGTYNYVCTPHATAGMVAMFTASAPLPVKLSEFKVSNENNKAALKWITASEDNLDYFSVQKSKTGADFVEIGRVPAVGHSTTLQTYTFTDPNPSLSDKYEYYNIAIVDKEGKKEFSPIGLFKNTLTIAKIILSLSPNPVSRSGHLMLKFNADKTSKMNVKIFNLEGRTVMETTMQAYEGVNNGHLMLGNISAGSYSARFELNGVTEVYKLIVK